MSKASYLKDLICDIYHSMKIKYPYTKPQSPTPFNSNSPLATFVRNCGAKPIPRYFRDSSVHSGRKTHSGCYLPMTSENINPKQSRKVTSSDRFICNLHIFRKERENHIEGGTRKPHHRVHGFDIDDCAILVIDYKSWTLGWDSL